MHDNDQQQPSSSSASSQQAQQQHFAARPRPRTPTGLSFSRLESLASADLDAEKVPSAGSHRNDRRLPPDSFTPIMRVIIPRGSAPKLKDGQRRYSTGQRDLYDKTTINNRNNVNSVLIRHRCGSTTAAWRWTQQGTAADIIESNPEFAQKAPRKPVEHRRSSRDWESFDDQQDQEDLESKRGPAPFNGGEEPEGSEGFVKALEEVRHQIEQVEQQLYHEEDADDRLTNKGIEQIERKMSETTPPQVARLDSVPSPSIDHHTYKETIFEPPAQFTSDPSYTVAETREQEGEEIQVESRGTVPVRSAPPPPPAKLLAAQSVEQAPSMAMATTYSDAQHFGQPPPPSAYEEPTPAMMPDTSYPYHVTAAAPNPFADTADVQGQQVYGTQNGGYPVGYNVDYSSSYSQQSTTCSTVNTGDYQMQYQQQQQQYSTTYGGGYYGGGDGQQQQYNSTYGEYYGSGGPQQQQYNQWEAYGSAAVDPNTTTYYGSNTVEQQSYYGTADPNTAAYYGNTVAQQQEGYGTHGAYGQQPEYGTVQQQKYVTQQVPQQEATHQPEYQRTNPFEDTTTAHQPPPPEFPSTTHATSEYPGTEAYSTSEYTATATYPTSTSEYTAAPAYPTSEYPEYVPPPTSGEPADFDTSAYGVPPPTTSSLFMAQPIVLPAQHSRTPDPYSWEAQESAYQDQEQEGTTAPMAPSPSRPPPPPPPPPPKATTEPEPQTHEQQQEDDSEIGTAEAGPPARPKGPPPTRPPAPSPSRPVAPPSPRPARKAEIKAEEEAQEEADDDDAWKRFRKMTERVGAVVKESEQRLDQLASTREVPEDDRLVQDYLAHTGSGTQLSTAQRQQLEQQEAERKRQKQEKKRKKLEKGFGQLGAAIGERVGALKRAPSPPADPRREEDLEKAAAELARTIAARHGITLQQQEADGLPEKEEKRKEELQREAEKQAEDESEKEEQADEQQEAVDQQETVSNGAADEARQPEQANPAQKWGFEHAALLPPSESDLKLADALRTRAAGGRAPAATSDDPFDTSGASEVLKTAGIPETDPFAPVSTRTDQDDDDLSAVVDPFEVGPMDELMARARQKAELELDKKRQQQDEHIVPQSPTSKLSTPTPEGGDASSVNTMSHRPAGFEDDFKVGAKDDDLESPLFDEDDSQPLPEFPAPFHGDGWPLFLRYPAKKKLMADRYWKPIYVRLNGNMLAMFNSKEEQRPAQEILIQATYSLSDTVLQPYDEYGKLHTVKLQHVLYKERVGIRPGQISRLVEGHVTKYGLPLEHSAQCVVLAKFGSLDEQVINSFTNAVEDLLFRCPAKRETAPVYRQDEVQIHCYDEYEARVDKDGRVSDQRARVRLFCLAFLSGSPFLEIGLNDRRREGKEVVRRKDILPMHTERWIRFEAPEFHETVEPDAWEQDQVVRLSPPDGCFFELMRFRVRPPRGRERPLSVKCVMRMAGSRIDIRMHAMAIAHQQSRTGATDATRTIPCEDIAIRFPLPEAWIYIFREQRHWGVGSVHSKTRKPGRVKNLRDKLLGTVQHHEPCLIEVGVGEAKYEHLFRSLVWRIPRLPERDSAVYKSYMLKCRFELSSFDLMPDQFVPCAQLEFTMPLAVVSNTVVRSVGVEQHEDSERVEKFVRYVAKWKYSLDIDYQQCADLDDDKMAEAELLEEPVAPDRHMAAFDPKDVQSRHEGYRIELPDDPKLSRSTAGAEEADVNGGGQQRRRTAEDSSSSDDEEDEKRAFPVVQIDMKGYGY